MNGVNAVVRRLEVFVKVFAATGHVTPVWLSGRASVL